MRKFLTFALVFVLGGVAVTAQTPPAPGVFSFSIDDGGGYLGVQLEEVNKENMSKFGLREVQGVAIAEVNEGSPAQSAGLQKGDVIVRVNGDVVTSSRKLTRLIGEISPDHSAKITVLRGGSEREINVILGKRPGPKFGNGRFNFPGGFERSDPPRFEGMPDLEKLPRIEGKPGEPLVWSFSNRRQIGIGLTPLTKQLGEHFGVDGGVLINTVRENSPAAKAGLKAGDIVVEVNGKPVKSDFELIRSIGAKKEGDITLTYVRGRDRRSVTLTPEEAEGGADSFFEFRGTPSVPDAPSVFRMTRPPAPGAAPAPLNRLIIPGPIV